MMLGILISIAAVVGLLAGWYFFIRKKKRPTIDYRVHHITDKRSQPSGMQIWVEKGATVTAPEIAAIERGLTQCFAKAVAHNYDRPLNLSDYKVAIIADSVRSPESQTWSYKVPAGPYAGTEWDMGGYILVGGQVIAMGEPYGNIIAIPCHHGTDLESLQEVTMYEAEHIILAFCDPDKYEATKIHGQGQGHPLF